MDELELTLDVPTSDAPLSNEEAANLADEQQKRLEFREQQEAIRLQQQEQDEQLALQKKKEIEDTRNKENLPD